MVPSYYAKTGIDPRCGKLIKPELDRAASEGSIYATQNNILPPNDKDPKVILSVIDQQLDFISPDIGNLCVPGAVEDVDRLNRFIYNNIGQITNIVASLDTHYLFQPFHRFNWAAGPKPTTRQNGVPYKTGEHPDPFTLISKKSIDDGNWLALRNPKHMNEMITSLETNSKKTLCIWPLHCILGTPGHAFDPTFMEAVFFHSSARNSQYDATTKGISQFSEHYGILKAEVEFKNEISTHLNTRILSKWQNADRVYFAGQAKSHCVLETLEQVISIFTSGGNNDVLSRLYVLEDCMSSVPDILDERGNPIVKFDEMTNNRFKEFKKLGVKFVKSTDLVSL